MALIKISIVFATEEGSLSVVVMVMSEYIMEVGSDCHPEPWNEHLSFYLLPERLALPNCIFP